MNYKLGLFYLQAKESLHRFLKEEQGDQQTGWFINVIISVVLGGLIMGGIKGFFPGLFTTLTDRITALL